MIFWKFEQFKQFVFDQQGNSKMISLTIFGAFMKGYISIYSIILRFSFKLILN